MGTTIVALKTKQGVVVGADTRTSQGTMVSNRFAHKLSFVYQNSDNNGNGNGNGMSCILCRSGSAADTQYLADEARWEMRTRVLRHHCDRPSLSQFAKWFRYAVQQNSYSASLICAGYDPYDQSGHIYSISPSASLIEEPVYATAGSGSTYIIGMMDHELSKYNSEHLMEEEEAIDFVASLIQRAIDRDGSSGGFARIVVMNSNGSYERVVGVSGTTTTSRTSDSETPVSGKELQGFAPALRTHSPATSTN